jgi:hypothetical protein
MLFNTSFSGVDYRKIDSQTLSPLERGGFFLRLPDKQKNVYVWAPMIVN